MPIRSIYRRTRDTKRNGRARSSELRREERSGAVPPAASTGRPASDHGNADHIMPMSVPPKQG